MHTLSWVWLHVLSVRLLHRLFLKLLHDLLQQASLLPSLLRLLSHDLLSTWLHRVLCWSRVQAQSMQCSRFDVQNKLMLGTSASEPWRRGIAAILIQD